jgi:hypothetical protein
MSTTGSYRSSQMGVLLNKNNVDTLLSTTARKVIRPESNLPQSIAAPIFSVVGGKCMIEIVGEVTTTIQSGANNMKLIANPNVGADVDLCATLDIVSDAVGTFYNLTGTLTDALVANTSGAGTSQLVSIIVTPGTIDLSCDASKSGQIKWILFYIPIDENATISVV